VVRRPKSSPGVGDLAQVTQGLVQLPQPLLSDVVGPLGEHVLDLSVRDADQPIRSGSQPHQAGPTVGGVEHALDVPGRLELLDQERDTIVRETALRSPLTHEEIVATLRGFVGSRRRVAFITDLEPLIDILVHTQDICRPLDIDHPMPPDAAAAAADRVLSTPWPIRRWRPPRGVRLVATDTDWAYGSGPELRAPMQAHLLRVTGRATGSTGSAPPPAAAIPEEER
jgi:hypothetical protein